MNGNKYSEIRNKYGKDTLHLIRKLETISKSLGRHGSHLRFNLQCKHTQVIPNSIKVETNVKGSEARRIIRKAEKAMLNIRISETNRKIEKLRKEKDSILNNLSKILPQDIYNVLSQRNKEREKLAFNKAREIQKKKYFNLKDGSRKEKVRIEKKHEDVAEFIEVDAIGSHTIDEEESVHVLETQREDDADEEQGVDEVQVQDVRMGDESFVVLSEYNQEEDEITELKKRWVKNLSSIQLTLDQEKLLQKGAGFAIAPMHIPVDDFIISTEQASKQMHPGAAAAMRAEIVELLNNSDAPISNLTKGERRAMKQLQDNKSIIIIPADKGKCLVVMDKMEYIQQMKTKLQDASTYKRIHEDPTKKIQELLSAKLKDIYGNNEIDYATYRKLFPKKTQIPRMYGQPKIHKEGYPLREIVDGNGGLVKDIDKHISKIIKPLTGKSDSYIRNSIHFASTIKDIVVGKEETLVSYDVTALYPSVPQNEALDIIFKRLVDDPTLKRRTNMTPNSIIELYKLCVQNTYFTFDRDLYIQVNGLAIGACTSGFVADIFMEEIEVRAMSTFIEPPSFWKRYVDDTCAKLKINNVDTFLEHLNSLHPRIKFTTEVMKNRKIAFLDTEVNVSLDGTIKFKIYRKDTHTDQYLDFTSNHHIKQKLGIIETFKYRSDNIVTDVEDRMEEENRTKKVLKNCGYPEWAFNKKKKKKEKDSEQSERRPFVSIPYVKVLSEKVARTFNKYGIDTIHKPSATVKNKLCKMKDRIHKLDRPGVNYKISCKKHDKDSYVGETERAMKVRGYEHGILSHKDMNINHSIKLNEIQAVVNVEIPNNQRRSTRLKQKGKIDYKKMDKGAELPKDASSSEVAEHMADGEHCKEDMTLEILGYEDNWWKRGIREAIEIRRHKPTLNKDNGRYHLTPIWNNVIKKIESGDLIGGKSRDHVRNKPNFTTEEDQPTGGRN